MQEIRSTDELLATVAQFIAQRYGVQPLSLRVDLPDGRRLMLPMPALALGESCPVPTVPPAGRKHSPDFCSVRWGSTVYTLTPSQAAVVSQLWDAMEQGTHCIQGATLLEGADCESKRLADVFRDSDAWGTLVVEGPVKGSYRLAE